METTAGVSRSRKFAFFLLLAVLAGTCAGLFFLIFEDAKKAAVGRLNERQFIHARQAASGISEYVGNWTAILTSLGRIGDVLSVNEDGMAAMDLFYEAHRKQIRSITRVSDKGVILYTVPHRPSIGKDISGQEHVREVLSTRKPVVSEVFRTVQGDEGVALHVPVFRGSVFKGTIAVVIDFEGLARRYLEVIRVGETGYAWVISREGTILFSPVPGFTGKPIS